MRKRTVSLLLSLTVMAALVLTACSGSEGSSSSMLSSSTPTSSSTLQDGMRTIKNVDGTQIQVPAEVKRVAAIFGPSYEKIVLLGAEDRIVCDGDFHIDGWPWSNVIYKYLNDVPGIPNAHSDLNIEELLGFDLDLVFNFPNPDTTAAMEEVGISVLPMASTGKLEDIKSTVTVYAEALGGAAPARAKAYADYYDKKVAMVKEIVDTIPEGEKKSVYMANQEILYTAGEKSDLVELMELAGGICVTKDLGGGTKVEVTREQLMTWNPDYIFVDHAGSSGNASAEDVVKELLATDEFTELSAAQNENVFICPTGVFFWDSGVQKPLLLMWMASEMYPEYFPDLDIKAELVSFYSEFFDYELTDEEATLILAHQNPPV